MTVTTVTTAAERAEIRAMARELAHRELAPRAAALDAGGQDVLAECWRLLVELGLDRALLERAPRRRRIGHSRPAGRRSRSWPSATAASR